MRVSSLVCCACLRLPLLEAIYHRNATAALPHTAKKEQILYKELLDTMAIAAKVLHAHKVSLSMYVTNQGKYSTFFSATVQH